MDARSNTLSRGVLQSAANLLIIMLAGGKHTYAKKGSNEYQCTKHALKMYQML